MTISENCHHALKDMVELQMYLVAQPLHRPWPLLSRRTKTLPNVRQPHHNPIESSVASELVKLGFIEYSSSVTLVVSKSGSAFYEREIKQ
jgi:hypothetical protein